MENFSNSWKFCYILYILLHKRLFWILLSILPSKMYLRPCWTKSCNARGIFLSMNNIFSGVIRSIALAIPWNYHAIRSFFLHFFFFFSLPLIAIVASYVSRERRNSLRNRSDTFHRVDQCDRWSASSKKQRFQAMLRDTHSFAYVRLPIINHVYAFNLFRSFFSSCQKIAAQSRLARKERRES